MQKAYLILENGTIFEGKSFGATGEAVGEVVFTTSMVGCTETLTDPSYYGQIVVQTFPIVGNYGFIPVEMESNKPHVKAYIVREWCQEPSNFRCEGNLDTFLKQNNIVGLYGIDTRQLTKILRDCGVMNGKIVCEGSGFSFDDLKNYKIVDAVKNTTSDEKKVYSPDGDIKKKVVMYDFGVRKSICEAFTARGCEVTVVPAYTKAEEVKAMAPDGIILSEGAGDPAENTEIIAEIAKLTEMKIPMFAFGLGHQLLALSQGAKTEKLKYGHHGSSQPVTDIEKNRICITAQNHGYTVVKESLNDNAEISFVNTNDGTCEGINYKNMPAFSVQFQPGAGNGPVKPGFLYDKFIEMMG